MVKAGPTPNPLPEGKGLQVAVRTILPEGKVACRSPHRLPFPAREGAGG